MVRALCVPYAFAGRAGAGLPRRHGLEDVLGPSASTNGHATPGNGRASTAAPLGSAMGSAVFSAVASAPMAGLQRPLAGVVGAPVFGAAAPSAGPFVDAWYTGPVYVAVPFAAQEWPFHALLERLRQQSAGA